MPGIDSILGFATFDNVLSALLGEIQDEFRHERHEWERLAGGALLGKASLPVYTLERALGVEIPTQYSGSVGGLIMEQLRRVPEQGERIGFEGFDITVLAMRGPRMITGLEPATPGVTGGESQSPRTILDAGQLAGMGEQGFDTWRQIGLGHQAKASATSRASLGRTRSSRPPESTGASTAKRARASVVARPPGADRPCLAAQRPAPARYRRPGQRPPADRGRPCGRGRSR